MGAPSEPGVSHVTYRERERDRERHRERENGTCSCAPAMRPMGAPSAQGEGPHTQPHTHTHTHTPHCSVAHSLCCVRRVVRARSVTHTYTHTHTHTHTHKPLPYCTCGCAPATRPTYAKFGSSCTAQKSKSARSLVFRSPPRKCVCWGGARSTHTSTHTHTHTRTHKTLNSIVVCQIRLVPSSLVTNHVQNHVPMALLLRLTKVLPSCVQAAVRPTTVRTLLSQARPTLQPSTHTQMSSKWCTHEKYMSPSASTDAV